MENAVPVHASERNAARCARRALRARARAGEQFMARARYLRIAPALLMEIEPNFMAWGHGGPEISNFPSAPHPRSLRSAARCARRAALERVIFGCAFTKNERQSRLQLTQHEVREPRMRCWGYCGRELCYFRALAYLDRWRAFERLGQVRQNSNRAPIRSPAALPFEPDAPSSRGKRIL